MLHPSFRTALAVLAAASAGLICPAASFAQSEPLRIGFLTVRS
jgi:hypothetical protein